METKFILVNSLTESLILTVLDYNDHRKNTELGFASFELDKLREDATQEGIEAPVLKDGKEKGFMRFDVSFFPVLKPEPNSTEPLPDTSEFHHRSHKFVLTVRSCWNCAPHHTPGERPRQQQIDVE